MQLKVKPYRDGKSWFMVSTIYEPPRYRSVGSGIIWTKPFTTREKCREAIRVFYRTGRQG